jgi:urease accessory protein
MDNKILQLSDSMFPIGGLAHSFGLETMVAGGKVTRLNLGEYLEAMLKSQVGPCDLVFMLNARDIQKAERLSKLYGCHKLVPEFHSASLKMGRRLSQLGFRLTGDARLKALAAKDTHHPIAFGAVSAAMGIAEKDAAYGFLYSWTASAASAAIRLMPLGHDAAQEILYGMGDTIRLVYRENKGRDVRDAWQYAPEAEIAGLEHRKLYTRLFLS